MATPQRLSEGQLKPAASPVSTFLNYDRNPQPGRPAQLPKLAQSRGITSIQSGRQRDVQGYNPIEQLTDALAPLAGAYNKGVEMFASDQYRRGQNEILRAAANISRDTIQKSFNYAADNRALDAVNPVAGVLMDQSNPFRQAGRVNQASQWVANLTPELFRAEWIKTGGSLAKLDPGDPTITKIQSRVTSQLAQSFGLDEFSPGFQQYVIPQINKSWEWFQNKQFDAHVNHQKAIGVAQTSKVLASALLRPNPPSVEEWNGFLNQHAMQFGLTGEPQKMSKEAVLQTLQALRMMEADPENRQKASTAITRLVQMPSGITDTEGNPISVGVAYAPELLSETADVSRDIKTIRENQKEAALEALEMNLPDMRGVRSGSPQWATLWEQMRKDPAYESLSDAELSEVLANISDQATRYQELTFDMDSVDDFFESQEELIGPGWDERAARARMRELRRNAPRDRLRKEITRRFEQLVDRSVKRTDGTFDQATIRRNISQASAAIIKELLPGKGLQMLQAARESGVGLIDYVRQHDATAAEALNNVENSLQIEIEAQIAKEQQDKGSPLTPGEQAKIANDVVKATLKDKALMESFRPVMEGTPPSAPASQSQSQGSEPPAKPTYFTAGQPVPEDVIKSGVPIYSPSTTTSLLQSAANGKPMPATVKRAARAANMTTGEFLLRQADQLGIEVPEQMRAGVRKVAVREKGTEDTLVGSAPTSSSPLSYASNAFLNILTGTRPAAAATRPMPTPESAQRLQVVPSSQYIATTGFGMSADGMTQTLHGIVGRNGYDKNHGVGNDHVHHGAPDQQTALALANFLKSNGVPITEFKPWGSVAPVHQDPGHYNGMSMDIPVGVEEHDRILRLIDTFYRSR